jgi:ATP-dependent DNA helicase RecG
MQLLTINIKPSYRNTEEPIIAELERRKRNISFNSEFVMDKPANDLQIESFKAIFQEKTGDILNNQVLKKYPIPKLFNK